MTALFASILVCLSAPFAERLEPKPLASFDGKSWAGLTLGSITDGDIKKQFQIDKGAVRPEALKVLTVKDSDVRVDALLDGRGEKAVMRAIRLEYDVPISVERVSQELGVDPMPLYMPERYEDWRALSFANRGVIGIEMNSRLTTFILCSPDQIDYALRDFTTKETEISTPRDPGQDWDRIVRFSTSDASVSLASNRPDWMNTDWRRRLERRIENATDSTREPSLRYTSSANGSLSIRVTSERFNSSGESNFTAKVSVTSTTPYGRFSQSASRSRKLGGTFDRKLVDLVEDALGELSDGIRYAVQKLGPPPRAQFRATALDRVMANASRKRSEN